MRCGQTITNEIHFGDSDLTQVSTCSACLNVIREDDYMEALNKGWHVDCFRLVQLYVLHLLLLIGLRQEI